MNAVVELTLRQMLGGRRIWFALMLLAIPILLVAMLRMAAGFGLEAQAEPYARALVVYALYPQSMCILLCLLYGTSLLAAEIEGKTLVYLVTHAQPRWSVLVAKYAATAVALTGLCLASMSVSFLVAGASMGVRLWAALAASVTGACVAYTAIFALLGLLLPRRSIAVGLVYVLVIEFALSLVPALVNEGTASYYLRSLAFQIADIDLRQLSDQDLGPLPRMFGGASLLHSVAALVAMTALALAGASAWFHRSEYPLSD